jgi:hypothetical protein
MRDRIPAPDLGAELQARYGNLGNYSYLRCHRLIADGKLQAFRDGRSRFFDRQQLPAIAQLFGIKPSVSNTDANK